MWAAIGVATVFVAFSASSAGQIYDAKLEQATKDVIARKIGGLRLGLDEKHAFSNAAKATKPADLKPLAEVGKVDKPRSTTSGSIQTFSLGEPDAPSEPNVAGQRSRAKLPRVFQF